MNISKRELTCSVDSLRDFLKIFDQASKSIQIPLPKPKVEIGSTKSEDNLLAHYFNEIIEHPNRQFRSSLKIWKQQFLSPLHQKVWTTRQSIHSYRNCQP